MAASSVNPPVTETGSEPGKTSNSPAFGLEARIANRNAGLGSVNEHESWSPFHREAYVLLGGLSDGIGNSMADAASDWQSTGVKVGTSAALGAGLAYMHQGSSMAKIGAIVIGAGFTYALVKDVIARAVPTYDAVRDAAKSGKNLDRDRAVVAGTAGPFVVDFALTSAGGMLGAGSFRLAAGKPDTSIAGAGAAADQARLRGAAAAGTETSTAVPFTVVASREAVPFAAAAVETRQALPFAAAASEAKPTVPLPAGAETAKATMPMTMLLDSNTVSEVPGAQAVYARALPSMLKIESVRPSGMHTGSAVVVDADGKALTNFHVVAHSNEIYALTPDGARYNVIVEKTDPGLDLAMIKLGRRREMSGGRIDYVDDKFVPANLSETPLEPGQRLFAVGYGENAVADNPRLSHGTFLGREAPPKLIEELPSTMRPTEQIARSAVELKPGFSGGPLLAENGDLVGLNFAKNQENPQSYAIPTDVLRDFMARRKPVEYSKFVPLLDGAQRNLSSTSWNGNSEQLGRLYDTASKGVVQIMGGTASDGTPVYGTAFAVDRFHLLTDANMVGEIGSPVKVTHNGVLHNMFSVDQKFPELGLALLRTDRISPLNLEPLPIAPSNSLFTGGQRIVTFGFKANQAEMTASPGQFGSYVPGKVPMIKTFVSVDEGYAGAPIMNRQGQVIGITALPNGAMTETNNVHARTLHQILRQAGIL